MNLSPETVALVRTSIGDALNELQDGNLIGYSCLAAGADSIFAQAVIDAGGKLTAIVSSKDYRDKKVALEDQPAYDHMLAQAAAVQTMPFEIGGREAYAAANEYILTSIDRLFAVWDGQPSTGTGGTADAVAQANDRGIPVTVIWPDGSRRI
jgi:hypothetical protein